MQGYPIYVTLPEQTKEKQGYVYVGPMGLKGGGKRTGLDLTQDAYTALYNVLPENYKLGEAYDNGDCFFDALAQCLNKKNPTKKHTVKSLRKLCYQFYQNNKGLVNSWHEGDKSHIQSQSTLAEYTNIQYTAEEAEKEEKKYDSPRK